MMSLWCRSRLFRSLDTWTGWFLDSLVLRCFLDSLLVLFSLSLLPLLPISWLILAVVPLSSLHPRMSFVCSLLPTPTWVQTTSSPSSPDFYLQRRPVYCAYPDRWNCWLSVSKADSLKSLQLLAESARFAIFPREPFPHILPWIQLIEPLSFQATHTWMPPVPSVCPGNMFLEAFLSFLNPLCIPTAGKPSRSTFIFSLKSTHGFRVPNVLGWRTTGCHVSKTNHLLFYSESSVIPLCSLQKSWVRPMPLFVLFVLFNTMFFVVLSNGPQNRSIATIHDSFLTLSFKRGGVGSAYRAAAAEKLSFVSELSV